MRRPSAASRAPRASPLTMAAGTVKAGGPFAPASKTCGSMPPTPPRAACQASSAVRPSAETAPRPVTTIVSATLRSRSLGGDQGFDLLQHDAERVLAAEGVLGDLDAVLLLDGEDDADQIHRVEPDVLEPGRRIELGPVDQRLFGDDLDQLFLVLRHRHLRRGGPPARQTSPALSSPAARG